MARNISKIIEEQINTWKLSNTVAKSRISSHRKYPIITISREFGARGAALGEYLGEKLGFKVWDKELLQAIANEMGGGIRTIESLDERRLQTVEDTITGFLINIPTNMTYLRSLIKAVKTIEGYGNGIIVGRGANYICKNPGALHIRVVSPKNERVFEYANRENISVEKARYIIDNKDWEREEFIRKNFHKDVTEPSDYHLVLNSEVFSIDQMASIVIRAYKKRCGREIMIKL
jgi:cytidylate kinase